MLLGRKVTHKNASFTIIRINCLSLSYVEYSLVIRLFTVSKTARNNMPAAAITHWFQP
jgi:hypothetical protein